MAVRRAAAAIRACRDSSVTSWVTRAASRRNVAHRFEEAILAVGDELRNAAHARCDRHGTPHAMASSAASPNDSISLGISSTCARADQPLDVVLLAEKLDVLLDAQRPCQMLGGSALGSVAHHQQTHVGVLADFGENADAVENALHGPEIREVDQQLLAIGREAAAANARGIGLVGVAVDEIVDDADFVADAEDFSTVSRRRSSLMAVTPSDCSMENFVMP